MRQLLLEPRLVAGRGVWWGVAEKVKEKEAVVLVATATSPSILTHPSVCLSLLDSAILESHLHISHQPHLLNPKYPENNSRTLDIG